MIPRGAQLVDRVDVVDLVDSAAPRGHPAAPSRALNLQPSANITSSPHHLITSSKK
jgi:hypothetical protein